MAQQFRSVGTSKFPKKLGIGNPYDKKNVINNFGLTEAGFYDLGVKLLTKDPESDIKEIGISWLHIDINNIPNEEWRFVGVVPRISGVVGFFGEKPLNPPKIEVNKWFFDKEGIFYVGCDPENKKSKLFPVFMHEDDYCRIDALRVVLLSDYEFS